MNLLLHVYLPFLSIHIQLSHLDSNPARLSSRPGQPALIP